MFKRTACPRAVRRRSCEPEGETCARKHEQIVADGEFVVVHRRFSGFRRDEPGRCRLRGAVPVADCAIIAHTKKAVPCTDGTSVRTGGT
jgi:hypothetical protein